MAKKTPKLNAVNPIKPVGLGAFTVSTYPMTRYLDYTEADWRTYSDQLINNGMGQGWDTMVTWMLASSPFVQTLVERRLNPILSAKYMLADEEGVVDEELSAMIDREWLGRWVEAAAMAIFQGYSAGVFDPKTNKVERYPISVIDPFNRALKHTPFDLNGHERFEDFANLFYVEYSSQHQTMLGLFQPLVKEYVGIAITLRNWLASGTRLAFPLTQVGYNGAAVELQEYTDSEGVTQQKVVNTNQETARQIAANIDPTVAITTPFTLEDGKQVYSIEVKQTEHHSGDSAYNTYKDYINEAEIRMINLVLGSQLTMKEGTSRSLGEVHERVTKSYQEKDIKWMVGLLNDILKPKLNIPDDRHFIDDSTSSMSIDDAKTLSDIVNANGKKLTQQFFTQIGLPENFYEDKSEGGVIAPPTTIDNPDDIKADDKEQKTLMRRIIDALTIRSDRPAPEPSGIVYLKGPDMGEFDAEPPKTRHAHLSQREVREMYDSGAERPIFVNVRQYRYYAEMFRAPLFGSRSQLAATAVPDDLIPRYMANIFQFSAAKDVAEQAALNDTIARSLFDERGVKVPYEQFEQKVQSVVSTFREDWLRTEYRTASMTAVMAQQWGNIWAHRDVQPYWRYRTQEDNKVREQHAELNGLVFRIEDQASQDIFPPNGWNCRCYFEGVSDLDVRSNGWSVVPSDSVQQLVAQDVTKGFARNAGVNGIMPNEGGYFEVLPEPSRLTYDQYKLDPVAKVMEGSPTVDVYQGTAVDISKMLHRAVTASGDIVVNNHTLLTAFTISASLRSRLEVAGGKGVNLLGETISHPDEMWLQWQDENRQTTAKGVMLKIAANVVYAVEFEDNNITDAYVVRSTAQADQLRRGMLVK